MILFPLLIPSLLLAAVAVMAAGLQGESR